jgi:antitoxin component YwqK of YwqJK toxin-antitoxin module
LSTNTRVIKDKQHANGTLRSRTDYVGCKKDGQEVIFDDTGRMISMANYVNDKLNGKYICLNNGCVNEYHYLNGILDGHYIERAVDGRASEGEYVNGKKYEYTSENTSIISPRVMVTFDKNGTAMVS